MAFKYEGMAVVCRSPLRIKLLTKFSSVRSQVSRLSSQADDNPLGENSKSRARDDRRAEPPDATEVMKDGITNMVDTAEAVGENIMDAAETVWDVAKEGAETVKDKIKDAGKPSSREDVAVARESAAEEEWKTRSHHSHRP